MVVNGSALALSLTYGCEYENEITYYLVMNHFVSYIFDKKACFSFQIDHDKFLIGNGTVA